MDFDYRKLGAALAWNRTQHNLRQIDVEILTDSQLKQPSISAAEHGETRLSVDFLIEYCNALGIRTDTLLDPFLTARPAEDDTGAIIDPYVIKLAEIMHDCRPEVKQAILKAAEIIQDCSGER